MASLLTKICICLLFCALASARRLHSRSAAQHHRLSRRSLLPVSSLCNNSTLTQSTFAAYVNSSAWDTIIALDPPGSDNTITLDRTFNDSLPYATNFPFQGQVIPINCTFNINLELTEVSGVSAALVQRPDLTIVGNTTCPYGKGGNVLNTTVAAGRGLPKVSLGLLGTVSAASCSASTSPLVKSLLPLTINGTLVFNNFTFDAQAKVLLNFTSQGICTEVERIDSLQLGVSTLGWVPSTPNPVTDMLMNQLIMLFDVDKDSILPGISSLVTTSLGNSVFSSGCIPAPKNSILSW